MNTLLLTVYISKNLLIFKISRLVLSNISEESLAIIPQEYHKTRLPRPFGYNFTNDFIPITTTKLPSALESISILSNVSLADNETTTNNCKFVFNLLHNFFNYEYVRFFYCLGK